MDIVMDTDNIFTTKVIDIGGQFITGVVDIEDKCNKGGSNYQKVNRSSEFITGVFVKYTL